MQVITAMTGDTSEDAALSKAERWYGKQKKSAERAMQALQHSPITQGRFAFPRLLHAVTDGKDMFSKCDFELWSAFDAQKREIDMLSSASPQCCGIAWSPSLSLTEHSAAAAPPVMSKVSFADISDLRYGKLSSCTDMSSVAQQPMLSIVVMRYGYTIELAADRTRSDGDKLFEEFAQHLVTTIEFYAISKQCNVKHLKRSPLMSKTSADLAQEKMKLYSDEDIFGGS